MITFNSSAVVIPFPDAAPQAAKPPATSGYLQQRQAWEAQIRACRKSAPAEKVVLLTIASHLNSKTFTAWPSTRTVAAECGTSRGSVLRCIKNGEAHGHLRVERGFKENGGRKVNVYVPIVHGGSPKRDWTPVSPGWTHPESRVDSPVVPDSMNDSLTDSLIQSLRTGGLLSQPAIPSEESQEKGRSLPRKEAQEAKEGDRLGQPLSSPSTPSGGGAECAGGVDSSRAVGGRGGAVGGGAAEALARAATVEGGAEAVDVLLAEGEGKHIGGLKRIIEGDGCRRKRFIEDGRWRHVPRRRLDVPGLLSSGAVFREGQIVFPVGCVRTEGRGFYMPDGRDEEHGLSQD